MTSPSVGFELLGRLSLQWHCTLACDEPRPDRSLADTYQGVEDDALEWWRADLTSDALEEVDWLFEKGACFVSCKTDHGSN